MVILHLIVLIVTVFSASRVGHAIVIKILEKIEFLPDKHSKTSEFLGYFERALIALFVCAGLMGQTVFIFAIKAAIMAYRIPKDATADKQRELSEYMLVGTMVSYLVALSIGILGHVLIAGKIL